MRLVSAQVQRYRNILDSSEVAIDPAVTCLVGKNESGKTAFLHALAQANPAQEGRRLSVSEQYPAWLEKQHRKQENLEDVEPVRVVFELDEADIASVEERFGEGVLADPSFAIRRAYNEAVAYEVRLNERQAVRKLLSQVELPSSLEKEAGNVATVEGLHELQEGWKSRSDEEAEDGEAVRTCASQLGDARKAMLGGEDLETAVNEHLAARAPRFFYFAEYTSLPGTSDVERLLKGDPDNLTDDERVARSLLRLAAADDDYLLNPDYDKRKRELENVANAITREVLEYWSQNEKQRVEIDVVPHVETDQKGKQVVLQQLKVRIRDERHELSLPFEEHSRGFKWFFSFLAAFSEYEERDEPVIILLDEPALALHAKAQKDFLRFINERLGTQHQVIYTTHSPFMVEPETLERVRLVQENTEDVGATVSQDVFSTDPDTLFPLQGALGYDIAQDLFFGGEHLVVEGTSDFTYLRVLSDFLREQERRHLHEKWKLMPVGGADLIPTFVALLGNQLDVTVLIDSRREGGQKLTRMANEGYLEKKRLVPVGEPLGRKQADIEDVFAVEDYLRLYNDAFGTSWKPADLTGTDPIASRIARHEGIPRFDHGRPADVLLRKRDEILPSLSNDTLQRFEALFERLNETLGSRGDA